jgi:hypothetical protein
VETTETAVLHNNRQQGSAALEDQMVEYPSLVQSRQEEVLRDVD